MVTAVGHLNKATVLTCTDMQKVKGAFDTLSKAKMLPLLLENFLGD